MNLYEDGLSRMFGLNPRKKVLRLAVAWTLAIASVVTPITFRHAILDYGQRRIAMVMKLYIEPVMKQLKENFDKQMRAAQLQQQKAQQGNKLYGIVEARSPHSLEVLPCWLCQ